jgi:exopolyphosphatase/guanosine-5'-triphosphate,3'-diphosphate pyrophosphatase
MLAAIDVGSNTVRMLLGEVKQGRVHPVEYQRVITRLKGGQSKNGLAPEAMERTLSALLTFQNNLSRYSPDLVSVVATEALRSAPNAELFMAQVRRQTGFELNIISGDEEAEYSARGALSVVDPLPEYTIIVDIGGGSTEIVLTRGTEVLFRHSCPLGVVRLADMSSTRSAREFIWSELDGLSSQIPEHLFAKMTDYPGTRMVGTAGTITTLAALDMKMATYDWRRVNNYKISSERIIELVNILNALSVRDREQLPGMEEGRGDLILPGLAVLQNLMNKFCMGELIISDFGLLEGLFLQMADVSAID